MDVSAFGISKHLSELVGRNVAVKVADQVKFSPQTRTACYSVEPHQGTGIVQLDLALLASLAGTMIGYPLPEVDNQIASGEMDENMLDASRELMNVLSAVIVSDGRAIFKGLYASAEVYSGAAADLLKGNYFPLRLLVTPAGGKAGCMLLVANTP